MTSRCEAITISLLSVAKAHQKKYCWVSQKRIQELLEKYHSLRISNRTLNRDLRWLEDNGYISRVRRLRRGVCGKLVRCPTLYKFKGKLFNWLYSIGNVVKRLFSFFHLPKWADNRQPQSKVLGVWVPGSSVNSMFGLERCRASPIT